MSAIAFDWVRAVSQAKPKRPANAAENCSRNEEFRLALDKYIASYLLAQGRRVDVIERPVLTHRKSGIVARFIGSIRPRLEAIREIWLFSRELSPDWRLPSPPRARLP